jgi:ethanolamine utilization protein EutQ (cupin superfamily)
MKMRPWIGRLSPCNFFLAVDEALAVLEGRLDVGWSASPAAVGESRVRFGRVALVEVC